MAVQDSDPTDTLDGTAEPPGPDDTPDATEFDESLSDEEILDKLREEDEKDGEMGDDEEDPESFDEEDEDEDGVMSATEAAAAYRATGRSISDIQPYLDYAYQDIDQDKLPEDRTEAFRDGQYQPRYMPETVHQWKASNLVHNPLYFEDPQLERYGHTYNCVVQPLASTGRFMVQLVGLPYQMGMEHPHSCRSTLGWYRPGECAPKLKHRIPINRRAGLVQTAVTAGLFLLIP